MAYDALGRPAANMGIALGDLNDDQIPDIYVTHMAGEMNVLYMSDGPIGYREVGVQAGLAASMHPLTTFGTAFFDIDHDGADDVGGGQRQHEIARHGRATFRRTPIKAAYWKIFAEPNMIFLNDGDGTFAQYVSSRETFSTRVEVSRGLCTGDIDNDGDLDMLLLNTAAPARLYRNVADEDRQLAASAGGRTGTGRTRRLRRARDGVRSGAGAGRDGSAPAAATCPATIRSPISDWDRWQPVDRIEVRWPDGSEETFPGGPVNQLRVLAHGSRAGVGHGHGATSLSTWHESSCTRNGVMDRGSRRHADAERASGLSGLPSRRLRGAQPASPRTAARAAAVARGVLVGVAGWVATARRSESAAAHPAGGNRRAAAGRRQGNSQAKQARIVDEPDPGRGLGRVRTGAAGPRLSQGSGRLFRRKPRPENPPTTAGRITWA